MKKTQKWICIIAAFAIVMMLCAGVCGCGKYEEVSYDEPEQKPDTIRTATMVLPLEEGTDWDFSQDNEIFDIKGEKTDEGMTYILTPLKKGDCKVTFTCKKGDKELYKVVQTYSVNVDIQAGFHDQKVETIDKSVTPPEIGVPTYNE